MLFGRQFVYTDADGETHFRDADVELPDDVGAVVKRIKALF